MRVQTIFRETPRLFPYDRERDATSPLRIALHVAEDRRSEIFSAAFVAASVALEVLEPDQRVSYSAPISYNYSGGVTLHVRIRRTFEELAPVVAALTRRGYTPSGVDDDTASREILMEPTGPTRHRRRPFIVVVGHVSDGADCVRVRDSSKDRLVEGWRWECSPVPGLEEPLE